MHGAPDIFSKYKAEHPPVRLPSMLASDTGGDTPVFCCFIDAVNMAAGLVESLRLVGVVGFTSGILSGWFDVHGSFSEPADIDRYDLYGSWLMTSVSMLTKL